MCQHITRGILLSEVFNIIWRISTFSNFFFDFHLFLFSESLFLRRYRSVSPRQKHPVTPRNYPFFTPDFGSTHMRRSADFEKKRVFNGKKRQD